MAQHPCTDFEMSLTPILTRLEAGPEELTQQQQAKDRPVYMVEQGPAAF